LSLNETLLLINKIVSRRGFTNTEWNFDDVVKRVSTSVRKVKRNLIAVDFHYKVRSSRKPKEAVITRLIRQHGTEDHTCFIL